LRHRRDASRKVVAGPAVSPSKAAKYLQTDLYPERALMASRSDQRVRRGAVIVAAALVAVVAYVLISGGGDDNGSGKQVLGADAAGVQKLAAEQDQKPYWAGPGGAQTFEWTDLPDGRVYVRYLTGGAKVGDPRARFLTVGTYPVGNGVAALHKAAQQPGAHTLKVKGGGTALINSRTPTSVYLAYPESKDQIEVFDPNPARALKLVTTGQIQPIP
jgi:hypothetical protein